MTKSILLDSAELAMLTKLAKKSRRNPSITLRTRSKPNTTPSSISALKTRTAGKIRFLEDQLASLDYYLPETCEYSIREPDLQKRA